MHIYHNIYIYIHIYGFRREAETVGIGAACIYIYIYIYIYVCVERERERERLTCTICTSFMYIDNHGARHVRRDGSNQHLTQVKEARKWQEKKPGRRHEDGGHV